MKPKAGWREIGAKSNEAMTRFHTRTGWEPTSSDMPFERALDVPIGEVGKAKPVHANGTNGTHGTNGGNSSFVEMVSGASDGEDGQPGEYEIRQRMIGVRAFIRFIKARAITPMDFFRQLAATMRAMHEPPFNAMTMEEVAMMEGQSKAAHSWRCKVLSGQIELAGMKGSKLPGQKSKAASESYRQARKGNCNRLGGEKAKRHAQRQASFLRKLKVQPKPKHTQ